MKLTRMMFVFTKKYSTDCMYGQRVTGLDACMSKEIQGWLYVLANNSPDYMSAKKCGLEHTYLQRTTALAKCIFFLNQSFG